MADANFAIFAGDRAWFQRPRSPAGLAVARSSACCQCRRLLFANAARCLARELEAPMTLTFAEFVVVWLFICGVSWTLILRVMTSNGTRLR